MSETRVCAPELPADLEWLNTDGPVCLSDQRGKVVLLDFWTYCCINCMHILPDLRYLENKYPDGLTVIGIHSPKFPNEKVAANVEKAINRYHIRHPVANDPSLRVWRTYGIRAWPSVVFIDPEGYVVGVLAGEGRRRQLDMMIQQHLDEAERKGIRAYSPMPVRRKPEPAAVLSFPGKVLAAEGRLFISDTGRNRVLEASAEGRIVRVYGSGSPGLLDGVGEETSFRDPQGMALAGEFLFVADTGNHAIRRINRITGEVQTVAGTGEQGRYAGKFFEDPARAPLNSPWDLAYEDGILYIAMAGQHQIWQMNLNLTTIGVLAGSGREDIVDGDPETAAFAQPSGLAAAGRILYVADSETSAVRSIRLTDGHVETLVGTGLFEFGDVDGVGRQARLQHPLGVVHDRLRNVLWIADTYNSKVKKLDLKTHTVSSMQCGLGLAEPGGLSFDGRQLWIADTNNHRLVRLAPDTGLCEPFDIHE